MTLPRWDEDMKYELLRLKSELRSDSFRVLHTPLGLGRVVGSEQKAALSTGSELYALPLSQVLFTPPSEHTVHQELEAAREAALAAAQAQVQAPALSLPVLSEPLPLPTSLAQRLVKILIVHSLDLGFVVVTLGLGLLLATWLIDPGNVSENPNLLKHAAPLRFLLGSNTLALVLGVYGFFSFYWLFFKLVSGSTLAESFLDNFWSLQNPRKAPSVKDSGDS